jgi:dolichyl-diphosphooligosaccharide--protein glycosyltransferase
MAFRELKNHRTYLIAGLILIFSLFALWLRLIPMFTMGKTDLLTMVGSDDPLYNLRQVEQLLANHFTYTWFDPMSYYPYGTSIYWGPLFIYISGVACLLAGAVTRPEIISVCLLVPPVMAMVTVILMYFIGRTCGDWKTGILASGFTAVVSGQFFYRSLYGYFDHHIGEVLFSTLFCLVYMYLLLSGKNEKIHLQNFTTWKKTAFLSVLAGIAYLLGLFLMPTMILFALIVGAFTVIQFIIDFYHGRSSEYLLLANAIIFVVAIIGLFIFGFKSAGLDLSNYTIGHIYAYLCIIGGTVLLYLLARHFKGKKKHYYPLSVAGCGIVFAAILFVASPQIYNLLIVALYAFFGQAPVTATVQEARGWSFDNAWISFNYGLILMIGGALVILYNNIRDERPQEIFALVWSLVILFSTCQHVRYEYYLAVNIALLAAVFVSFTLKKGWGDLKRLAASISTVEATGESGVSGKDSTVRGKRQRRPQKKGSSVTDAPNYLLLALVVVSTGLGILFAYTSVYYSYVNASGNAIQMNQDWKESLEWLGNNTPNSGVDYYTIYDPKTFKYPATAYGIMSWWDYGHMITYIAKRIPNANPFQQGVTPPIGASAYFVSTSEDDANHILDTLGTKYVITDIEMDSGKFWAMATWYNTTAAGSPYQMNFVYPSQSDPSKYDSVLLYEEPYFQTMVSRLHNFDGSMTPATSVYYIEYADPNVSHVSVPVITNAIATNSTDAAARAAQYNLNAPSGYHATVLSSSIVQPLDYVPALRHYRLIHESPTTTISSKTYDVKYVKIFEYVKGAHIKGNGIIDVPVITNTGRNFTYRQQSINGEFIVPYATTGSMDQIKATGPYHIEGTSTTFDIPESAVENGLAIN